MIFYAIMFSFIGFAYTNIVLNDLAWPIKQHLLFNDKIPDWIRKPLGGCSICFTGQLTLWGSIPLVEWNYVGIISWIGIVSLNMIIVLMLNKQTDTE
jgi:hypothetical protein